MHQLPSPHDLRELVLMMRELGVDECDGIKLGPETSQSVEMRAKRTKERERSRDRSHMTNGGPTPADEG